MDKYPQKLELRFEFTEQQFSYTYFSIVDLVSELGGISGIIGGIFAGFAIYLLMLYVVDLVTLIQNKFKFVNNKFVIRYHIMQCKNLEKFRKVIEGLIEKEREKGEHDEDHLEEGCMFKKLKDDLELLDKIELWIWKSAPELLPKTKRKLRDTEFDAKKEAEEKEKKEK